MFAALARETVTLKMITTSDIKISVLVDKGDAVRALRAVHQAFGLAEQRPGAGQPIRGLNGSSAARSGSAHRDMAALTQRLNAMEDILVTDVLLSTDQGRITVFGLPNAPGNCSQVFHAIAAGGIVVDMIIQNMAEGYAHLSFSVPQSDLARALSLTQNAAAFLDTKTRVTADAEIATLFVLGVGMRTHTGVARRMFGALAERGINVGMINTSEVRISVVVDRAHGEEALACLRKVFNV